MVSSDKVDFFAFAGQSNALGHFWRRDGDPSLKQGSEVFEDRIKELTGNESHAFNTAVGGAGSNNYSNPDNYWWDLENDEPGPLLLNAVADIKANLASGQDLDGVIWCQGETDAYSILYGGDGQTFTDYFIEATTKTFAYFREQFGSELPILIQELGDFPVPDDALEGQPNGFDLLRDAQADIIDSDPHTYLAADTTGLPYYSDNIHYPTSTYDIIAEDLAETAVSVISGGSNPSENVAPIIDAANTQADATIYEIYAGAEGAGFADVKASGAIVFTDANAGDVHTASVTPKGDEYYGDFEILSIVDGKVNWQFTINDSILDVLDEGEAGSQSYDVEISDGNGGTAVQTVTITAFGKGETIVSNPDNSAPVIDVANTDDGATIYEIDAGAAGEKTADVTATGVIAFSDVDVNDVHTASVIPNGTDFYGDFNIISIEGGKVNWQFTINDSILDMLDEGESGSQSYDIAISDGNGGTATQTVTITAFGKGETIVSNPENSAPVIDAANTDDGATIYEIDAGAAGEKTADVTATGAITFSDVDVNDIHTAIVSPFDSDYYGDFSITSIEDGKVNWQFTINDSILDVLDEGESGSQSYFIIISDGNGGSVSQTVTITAFGKGETIVSDTTPTDPVDPSEPSDLPYVVGTDGDDLINLAIGQDTAIGSAGNDTIHGRATEVDQMAYEGSVDDYLFTSNTDGSINVVKPDGIDTLHDIDGVWFQSDSVWLSVDELVTDDSALA